MALPGSSSAAVSHKKLLTILDLPTETLKDIFQFVPPSDLVALSLVSKHFRDISAIQLYRSFHIVFPREHEVENDALIDVLAGGLDTFVTSEYDYAKYLREIVLETLSGGDKGERACRDYFYNVSCGKFMNTLFLLTLRKAKALETFRWDIRVELSREVFKALHGIESLRHLHLRMQVGPSIYQTPPEIVPSTVIPTITPIASPPIPHPPHTVPLPLSAVPPEVIIYYSPPTPYYSPQIPQSSALSNTLKGNRIYSKQKHGSSLPPITRKIPSTISGFKNLESLVVLDMDTLDYVTEIKECIEKSSSTLKVLKLSFSENLAKKSRKPPPDVHSDDDSDLEDDFGQPILPSGLSLGPSGISDPNGPTKVFNAQEEKKRQEAVLGKIFGIAPEIVKVLPIELPEKKAVEDPKKVFVRNLAPVAKLLMSTIKDNSELSSAGHEALDLITKAAKLYIESADKSNSAKHNNSDQSTDTSGDSANNAIKSTPESSATASADKVVDNESVHSEPGLFDKSDKKKTKASSSISNGSNPEDIDIEEPEVQEPVDNVDDAEDCDTSLPEIQQDLQEKSNEKGEKEVTTSEIELSKAKEEKKLDDINKANRDQLLANLSALTASQAEIKREIAVESDNLQKQLESFQLKSELGTLETSDYDTLAEAEASYRNSASRFKELDGKLVQMGEQIDELKAIEFNKHSLKTSKMSDYVRSTRGLTLKSLAIYLIPIKASILSRAIDLSVLREITLLNVGHQTSFWTAIARENQMNPVSLKSIYTDNVTLQFLAFINQLERVEELLLLERAPKQRVEPTTPKTTATIEQIRKIALKKHARSLKVLMIRNDSTDEWDLEVKTVILLCQRAKALKEMAVKFSDNVVHTLFQFMPGLESLRALHTIEFRCRETCAWVMQEFRKFVVDNVAHNPEMKLEYLALGASVDRLVRHPLPLEAPVDRKGKGKETTATKGPTLAQLAVAQHKTLAQLALAQNDTSWSSTGGIGIGSNALDILNSPIPGFSTSWDDSDDEDLDVGGKSGLRIEMIENMPFYEVTDVRIFEKDILLGRL